MAIKLSPILARVEGVNHCLGKPLLILCPACKELHPIPVEATESFPKPFMWNGDAYFPSILNGPMGFGPAGGLSCSFHIHNGYITFEKTSKHDLAGTTVRLPIIPDFLLSNAEETNDDFAAWVSAGQPLEFPA